MEYYSGGTLMQALGSDSRVLGWRQRITLALQVASGLQYLHEQGIAHGDIKSSNVLIAADGKVGAGRFSKHVGRVGCCF
jgi:serine/threonine protein kinase